MKLKISKKINKTGSLTILKEPFRFGIKSILFLAVLGMFFTGCAKTVHESDYYRTSNRNRKFKGVIHTVEKGETFGRIAKTYGLNAENLASINRIKNVNKLKEGQKIYIPGATKVLKVPKDEILDPKLAKKEKSLEPKTESMPEPLLADAVAGEDIFSVWPVEGRILSPFGMRGRHNHEGMDISAVEGTEVKAVAPGKVIYSDNKMRYYGNVVIIKHSNGLFTVYAHNSSNLVEPGDTVEKGQLIARSGRTGRASCAHVHFEVRQGERPVNPERFLPKRGEMVTWK